MKLNIKNESGNRRISDVLNISEERAKEIKAFVVTDLVDFYENCDKVSTKVHERIRATKADLPNTIKSEVALEEEIGGLLPEDMKKISTTQVYKRLCNEARNVEEYTLLFHLWFSKKDEVRRAVKLLGVDKVKKLYGDYSVDN